MNNYNLHYKLHVNSVLPINSPREDGEYYYIYNSGFNEELLHYYFEFSNFNLFSLKDITKIFPNFKHDKENYVKDSNMFCWSFSMEENEIFYLSLKYPLISELIKEGDIKQC